MSSNSTVAADPAAHSPYGYVPTEWITLMFLGLFAVSTLTHFFQAFYYRVWWLLPTAFLAGVLECAGWAARFWSSQKPALLKPYIIQTTATIIGPTPLLATNFIILEKLIHLLGPQYSRLPPKLYGYIFLSCDLVALTVQAYGGTVASKAVSDHKDPETGGHIMLGGIIFQMVAIIVYVILATEFFFRLVKNRPLKKDYTELGANRKVEIPMPLKSMIGGLVFMTTCIFIRSIYRTVELIDGFTGKIIETQILFNLFDGAMIVLAIYALNYFHPGRLLAQPDFGSSHDRRLSEDQVPLQDYQGQYYDKTAAYRA